MPLRILAVYPQRCTGCRLCEQFCSWKHHGAVSPARARITIHRLHEAAVNVPVACSQCVKAPCISVCPEGVITRLPETGGLHLDQEKCIGCRMCVEICPRGCIKVDGDDGTPLLCDLCNGDPQCAAHCPEAAILYAEPEVIDRGYREIAVQRMGWGRDSR